MPQAGMHRALAGRGALLFGARLLPAVALLAVAMLLSHNTPKAWLGKYSAFYITLAVLLAFSCAGFAAFSISFGAARLAAMVRIIPRRYISGYLLFTFGCAGLFAFLQAEYVPVWLSAMFLLVNTAGVLAESFLLAGQRFRTVFLLNGLYAVLYFALHYQFVVSFFTFYELLLLTVVLLSFRVILLLIIAAGQWKKTVRTEGAADAGFPEELPAIRKLWWHLGFYDVLQQAYRWIDKAAVALVLPLTLTAVYTNGAMDVPFLPLLLGAAGSSALSFFANANHDSAGRVAAVRYLGVVLSGVTLPLSVFLFLFGFPLITIAFSTEYAASVPVFKIMLLTLPVRSYPFTTLLQQHRRGDIILRGAALDVIILLLLMWPGYQLGGLPGVAAASVISTYTQAGYYLWHTGRITASSFFELLPLKIWALRAVIVLTAFFLLGVLSPLTHDTYIALTFGAGVTGLLCIGFLVYDLQLLKRNAEQK